jgi:hypothetical protein
MAKKEDRYKDAGEFIKQSSRKVADEEVTEEFKEEQKKEYTTERWNRELGKHNSKSPALSGGDLDARWSEADVGEETAGGDVATPDQDIVEEQAKALGVSYQDNEPLKGSEKLQERDRKRWELDPASSEDYPERTKPKKR